ncbi:winged helix-turn-helix transcriptional regulator [Amycolatopsis cihanbeyliensis]|uniref:HxlR family transcriptional regulator n=1 Tax=Amycolatopsis cihanbeyliensis TaxID=1128664 RepID=A0A542DQA5_AMYCI|nr:helix-turn-helix domain-containing protein [Amycolatopsis cihanbeyliensis]TQJ05236.1 HxlR family transcriptional regulator [Amycolatopsis cihanbeyliensis]
MAPKRSYDDGCATAYALDLVGERWGLLIVRELLLGPKRFTDLRGDLPGVSPTVLAQRLREFIRAGVAHRRRLPPPMPFQAYELTEWGYKLEPVIHSLGRWALQSPDPPRSPPLSVDANVLSLRVMFDPVAAEGRTVRFGLCVGDRRYQVCVVDGELQLARGEVGAPDATIETNIPTLHAYLCRTRSLSDSLERGEMRVRGSMAAAAELPTLFRPIRHRVLAG